MPAPSHLVVDIETAPAQPGWAQDRAREEVKAPSNYKDPDKIAAYVEDRAAEAVANTAKNGTYGQIAAIGWQWWPDDQVFVTHTNNGSADTEHAMLAGFLGTVRDMLANPHAAGRIRWTGYNICGFDLRWLWQRAHVHGLDPSLIPHDAKPWSSPRVYDLMHEWCGTDKQQLVPKEDVARALGIPVPATAVHGSQVPLMWAAGQYEAIAEHCRQDVEMEAAILARLLGHDGAREARGRVA